MAVEIERKFLVGNDDWKRENIRGLRCCQGYIAAEASSLIRVRIAGERGFLTIKQRGQGLSRYEYEYEIPLSDAREMLNRVCPVPLIEKMRYEVMYAGKLWEIDVFEGPNRGLTVAEIELRDETETIVKPPWLGMEITDDPRYLNINLAKHPYQCWFASG